MNAEYQLEHAVLELLHFPAPHTGNAIGGLMKKVLNEWNFYFFIIVTDNGANMIKVFQLATTTENVEAVINDVAAGQNESAGFLAESTDEESKKNIFS